jgi:hypothetical protein
MVEATLRQLDTWYREPSDGAQRPKLLSKLALLELCGWLEGEFDHLILRAQAGRLGDEDWVRKKILERTNGFDYEDHFRPMLCRLVGEVFARKVEAQMEAQHPGDLLRLKGLLGDLWKKRCAFAHADVAANVASQQTFDAPSWTSNQFRILNGLIRRLEASIDAVLRGI